MTTEFSFPTLSAWYDHGQISFHTETHRLSSSFVGLSLGWGGLFSVSGLSLSVAFSGNKALCEEATERREGWKREVSLD